MGQVLAGVHHVAVEEVNGGRWLDKEPDHLSVMYQRVRQIMQKIDSYSVSVTQSPTFPFNSSSYSECHPQSTNVDIHVLFLLLSVYNLIFV